MSIISKLFDLLLRRPSSKTTLVDSFLDECEFVIENAQNPDGEEDIEDYGGVDSIVEYEEELDKELDEIDAEYDDDEIDADELDNNLDEDANLDNDLDDLYPDNYPDDSSYDSSDYGGYDDYGY